MMLNRLPLIGWFLFIGVGFFVPSAAMAQERKLPEVKDPEATPESLVAAAKRVYDGVQRAFDLGEPITPPFITVCLDASKQLHFAERDLARFKKNGDAEKASLTRYLERTRALHKRVDNQFREGKTASEIPSAMTAHAVAEAELWRKQQENDLKEGAQKEELRADRQHIIEAARRVDTLTQKQQDLGEPITTAFVLHQLRYLQILCDAERDLARTNQDLLAERAAIVNYAGRVQELYRMLHRRIATGWYGDHTPILFPTRNLIAAKLMLAEFDKNHPLPQVQEVR